MLTLDDIRALPNDPSEEHLIAAGLLPKPAPPPSIIPAASGPIPTPSAVTPRAEPSADWKAKLAATAPHAATVIPPMQPVAPDLGSPVTPGNAGAHPTDELSSPTIPALPNLNFKERQALPITSPGAPANSSASFRAQIERLQDQKAHPWGTEENHPGLLGKIAHYAAKVGNIAGDIFAPATMANIPGTELNKTEQLREAESKEAKAEGRETAEKTAESENELRAAETKKNLAMADREPGTTAEREVFKDLTTGENGGPRVNPDTGKPYTALEAFEAVRQAEQKSTTKPESIDQAAVDAKMKETNPQTGKPFTAYEARVELANDIAGGKSKGPSSAEEDQRYEKIMTDVRMGKPVSAEDRAWAGVYEKRKTLGPFAAAVAQAPQKSTERSDKSYQYNATALEKVATPVEQTMARMGRLMEALNQHTPAADALVGPELLTIMAGGQGSGLRMTEAEISRIVGGRSHWQDLQAAVQKWSLDPSTANSITADQRKQMRDLASAVQRKLVAKQVVLDKAHEELLDSEDPKDHRRAVTDARRELDKIDAGAEAAKIRGEGGEKIATKELLDAYAKAHNVSVDEAKAAAKKSGYKIQGEK